MVCSRLIPLLSNFTLEKNPFQGGGGIDREGVVKKIISLRLGLIH